MAHIKVHTYRAVKVAAFLTFFACASLGTFKLCDTAYALGSSVAGR